MSLKKLKSLLIWLVRKCHLNEVVSAAKAILLEARQSNFSRGDNVLLTEGCLIEGGENITVGSNCYFGPGCEVTALKGNFHGQVYDGRISIGNNLQATGHFQIIAGLRITIGSSVLIARGVFICDCMHGISDGERPYREQGFEKVSEITIGDGSWLGQNVVILPGVKIGKQVVIGANSVVSKDIPDFSIAAGIPAKVIKAYDTTLKKWIGVNDKKH